MGVIIIKQIIKNWDKVILLLIMMITGFLSFYAIGKEGYSNQYYAAAVKSMLTSWHNFFFASFDPGGFVTVDKPALGLWLQAASAFVFGFHGWSIILPEAFSAVASVAILFHLVSRSFGKTAGLAASSVLGLTPILIAVSRTNNLDSSLVMVLLLATWAVIVAAERGSFKWLFISMALVGCGFNIKMLEAFMVLPAFYLVYLLTSEVKFGRRVVHLLGATAVLLAVSLSWAVIVDLIPADSRPYVGGSKTNSVLELALGYNGIQRVTGNQSMGGPGDGTRKFGGQIPPDIGSRSDTGAQMQPPPDNSNGRTGNVNPRAGFNGGFGGQDAAMGGPGGIQENGQKGVFRIFNNNLAGQISWFLLFALFGSFILGVNMTRKNMNRNNSTARYMILFTTLILVMTAFFSIAGFYHRYYLSMMAPAIAALSGIGFVEMGKEYIQRTWKWFILPMALLANAAIQVMILLRYPGWSKILVPVVSGVSISAVVILIVLRFFNKENMSKLISLVLVIAFVAFLTAPAVWSYTPVIYGTQAVLPVAGPELQKGYGWGQGNGFSFLNRDNQNMQSSQLVKFLLSKYNGEKFLVAVADAGSAEAIILETGKPVMAIGGFSGNDNILTVNKLENMVQRGEIRYFEVGFRGMGQNSEITVWVREHGKAVSIDDKSAESSEGNFNKGFGGFGGFMGGGTLYDLAPEKG